MNSKKRHRARVSADLLQKKQRVQFPSGNPRRSSRGDKSKLRTYDKPNGAINADTRDNPDYSNLTVNTSDDDYCTGATGTFLEDSLCVNGFIEGDSWFEKLDFESLEKNANARLQTGQSYPEPSTEYQLDFDLGVLTQRSPRRDEIRSVTSTKSLYPVTDRRPMLCEATNTPILRCSVRNPKPIPDDPKIIESQNVPRRQTEESSQLDGNATAGGVGGSRSQPACQPSQGPRNPKQNPVDPIIGSQNVPRKQTDESKQLGNNTTSAGASGSGIRTACQPSQGQRGNVRSAFKSPLSTVNRTPVSVARGNESRSITTSLMSRFRSNSNVKINTSVMNRSACQLAREQAMEVAMAEAMCLQDVDSQFGCDTFHGLPLVVKDLIKKHKGIENLYDWQKECLNLSAVQNKTNLIYCLPTSGGKTLVAEILIWKEILCYNKNALFVLPFVSIVQQKVSEMSQIALELNIVLEEYAGSKGQMPPRKHLKKPCIYIATIEKANMLINCFLEEDRMRELGLVVVDELHMVGENGGRGAVLETMLTKLLFCSNSPMICGMSATIGNINDLRRFLNAEVYQRNFRPVQLYEYVKLGNCIYSVNKEAKCDEDMVTLSRTLSFEKYTKAMLTEDKDFLAGLVTEVIPQHSCLVFCPTKSNCENVAKLVCKIMDKSAKQEKATDRQALLESLSIEGNGEVCPVLARTVPFGVAYHHSGLTLDERALLEQAYSNGTLSCLTCTSTLAAGVNLPAKRVIVRAPYIGRDFITLSRLKQMIGRAGRTGIDSSGESILIVPTADEKKVGELLRAPMDQCKSTLLDSSRGLAMLLLSAIGLKIVLTEVDIQRLVFMSLLRIQKADILTDSLEVHIKCALTNLKDRKLVAVRPTTSIEDGSSKSSSLLWEVTHLGKATFKGCIDLEWSKTLYQDLKVGLQSLSLNTHLHLLYLVTPYHVVETISLIPDVYFKTYNRLTSDDFQVAKLIGVTNSCIVNIVNGRTNRHPSALVVNRFYVTLILYDLWKQNNIWQVAAKFRLPRGQVQNLLSSAASFATCTMNFCKELEELWAYNSLFPNFIQQLSHCVSAELLQLMELPLTNRARARQLYNAGFKTLSTLAQTDPKELAQKVLHMPRNVARTIIDAAKVLILKKADELQDQVEELFAA